MFFKTRRIMVVFLVTGLVAVAPLARAGERAESGREVMSRSTASQAVDGQAASEGETPELLEEESRIDVRKPRPIPAQQGGQTEREELYYRYLEFSSYVTGGSIEPHWMVDGSSFWYAEGVPDNTVIWKVDPTANTKNVLFDTARQRQALAELLGHEPPNQGLPFDKFNFVDESEAAVEFTVENIGFILQLDNYAITRASTLSEEEEMRLAPRAVRKGLFAHWPPVMEVLSPDRQWFASVTEHNLTLRSTHDARSVQITNDGIKDFEWDVEGAKWSPDSFRLAVTKVNYCNVPRIPIVHWTGRTEEVEWMRWRKAGKPLPQTELYIVDIRSKRKVRVDTGEELDQYIEIVGWRPDGSELLFLRTDRTLKRMFLMAANPTTGTVRVILTETQKTFVIGLQVYYVEWTKFLRPFTWLDDGKRFIWMSERDGWNHLYLYDMDGTLIRQLTTGNFPVVEVIAVDEKAGWVYCTGHGDKQRPYDTHLYRVDLDGKRFTRLTEATGRHDTQFAPSKKFFLDTHSSLDRPPVVELRRADGALLQTLSEANIGALRNLRWKPPETFVVKAADRETDLYGVLYKPFNFDPDKKYPVIESIYAGPQMTFVPATFTDWGVIYPQALAQLGFVVFQVDGRGTPDRGKAFQDVVYGNFGRHEIPDHLATLKQLAEERPYMDLSRVGILGHSWGGYFAIRAMLLAPDVYHVGIASAPAVAMSDFSRSIEPYMGLPQNNKEGYEYGSNLLLAGNLKGKVLLIHGTSDDDVPFSATMKMVDAFTREGKPYDLIVLPEQTHAIGSGIAAGPPRHYLREAIRRYFQEHLKP